MLNVRVAERFSMPVGVNSDIDPDVSDENAYYFVIKTESTGWSDLEGGSATSGLTAKNFAVVKISANDKYLGQDSPWKNHFSTRQKIEREDGALQHKSSSVLAKKFLDAVYGNSCATKERALDYVFGEVERSLAKQDLLFLNEVLNRFDPSLCMNVVSTGLLRATYRVRSRLPAWLQATAKLWCHLNQNGENARHLLRGLVRTDDKSLFSTRPTLY